MNQIETKKLSKFGELPSAPTSEAANKAPTGGDIFVAGTNRKKIDGGIFKDIISDQMTKIMEKIEESDARRDFANRITE